MSIYSSRGKSGGRGRFTLFSASPASTALFISATAGSREIATTSRAPAACHPNKQVHRLKTKKGQSIAGPALESRLKLKQRRSAPLPSFILFFRHLFNVVHVGTCLREHVVQVVAETVEGEPLF